MLSRRSFLATAIAGAALPAAAQEQQEFEGFNSFLSKIGPLGRLPDPSKEDFVAAAAILAAQPTTDAYSIMLSLSQVTTRSSTGELFIARWKTYGNPLLIKMFKDIGYTSPPDPGDCTSWCAASLSWCLRRAGKPIPTEPASSQSFLSYGSRIDLANARAGDICVLTNISDRAHGHVALLYPGAGAGKVRLLGGNQASSGATNCSRGYGQSRIAVADHLINPKHLPGISHQYLAQIRRS